MPDPLHCHCTCHRGALADFRALFQEGRFVEAHKMSRGILDNWEGVDVRDILEAAAACPDCIDRHCPALMVRREKREQARWVDPPLMPPPVPGSEDDGN